MLATDGLDTVPGTGSPERRAPHTGTRWLTLPVLFAITAAMFSLGFLHKLPCHTAEWPRDAGLIFGEGCYSDIPYLYRERGFDTGDPPYRVTDEYQTLEYPVLTGYLMDVTGRLTRLLAGVDASQPQDTEAMSARYFEINMLLLFGCALLVVWATARTAGVRSSDAWLVAAAPGLAVTGTINWDLLAVGFAALAMYAWSRRQPALAGLLLGLGTATKLYPLLLAGPLFLLCLRAGRWRAFGVALAAGVTSWLAVNLPLMLTNYEGWREFWIFNSDREADFGSFWYVLRLADRGVEQAVLNPLWTGLFAAACAGIAALALLAPKRPRLPQLAFLVVAAFVMANKVYSPQYVLWLLPLAVLARPRWRDWAIWQAAELAYWVMIWQHLESQIGHDDVRYSIAVVLRIAATLYLCVQVVIDILRPDRDVVRAHGQVDDPAGGVFDSTPDARPWPLRLRHLLPAEPR